MKILLTLTALIFNFLNFAIAENEHGNGGDVVVCRNANSSISSIRLLDYYEAKLYRGIDIDLGAPDRSVDEKIKILADRLSERNPIRAKTYLEKYKTFMEEVQILPNIELTDINDSMHVAVEKGCRIEQIVIQKEPNFPGDKRYTISADLWNALSNDHKAGLIWHELIYGESSRNGANNSIASRYFNALIAGNKIKSMTIPDWVQLMNSLRFGDTEISGIHVKLPGYDMRFKILGGTYIFYKQVLNLKDGEVLFYPNGSVKSFHNSISSPKMLEYVTEQGDLLKLGFFNLNLNEDGKVEAGILAEEHLFQVASGQIKCSAYYFSIYPTGLLKYCMPNSGTLRSKKFDITIPETKYGSVYFDFNPQGDLVGFRNDSNNNSSFFFEKGRILIQGRWIDVSYQSNLYIDDPQNFSISMKLANSFEKFKIKNLQLRFIDRVNFISKNDTDSLISGSLAPNEKFIWSISGKNAKFGSTVDCGFFQGKKESPEISFFDNGDLRVATLIEDTQINGKTCEKGHRVGFNEKGLAQCSERGLCD